MEAAGRRRHSRRDGAGDALTCWCHLPSNQHAPLHQPRIARRGVWLGPRGRRERSTARNAPSCTRRCHPAHARPSGHAGAASLTLRPSRCVHHAAPLTLRPSRCVPHAASLTLRPSRCAPHAAPLTLRPSRCAPHAASITLRPSRCAHHAAPLTLRPSRCAPHAASITLRASRCAPHAASITLRPSRQEDEEEAELVDKYLRRPKLITPRPSRDADSGAPANAPAASPPPPPPPAPASNSLIQEQIVPLFIPSLIQATAMGLLIPVYAPASLALACLPRTC
jgi:hypothetical protein